MGKAGGKHRQRNGVKRVHTIIPELEPILLEIGSWPEVRQVTPAQITHIKGVVNLKIKIQAETESGFRCVAIRGSAKQLFFVVTTQKNVVRKKLQALDCYT